MKVARMLQIWYLFQRVVNNGMSHIGDSCIISCAWSDVFPKGCACKQLLAVSLELILQNC